MSYNVEVSAYFSKQLKRLIRKYPSLKTEIVLLVDSLEKSPVQGTSIGKDCYKIRVAISSKGKGKSGGARVITHIYVLRKTVYLLCIYDKSEQANIPASILDALLNGLK